SVVVLAYHEMGFQALALLLRRGLDVSAVFTHDDDPDENCWFGSVASLARDAGIPTVTTRDVDDPTSHRWISELRPELIFSFCSRRLVRKPVRDVPRLGAVNLHASLLPRYRGRSPVNWQLVHGERESGVTLHHMIGRADAGDIVGQERVAVGP